MRHRLRRTSPFRALAGTGILLTVIALSACTSVFPQAGTTDPAVDDGGGTTGSGTGAAPTCETIISPALLENFEELGWTSRADPFYVGPTELTGGVSCKWGNFDVGANDLVQMYGWAPVDDEQSTELQDYLVAEGWVREEGDDGIVYVTEGMPSAEWSDEDGYGMTYAFGDGWVELSDTKNGLDVITWSG
ncbi:hypothetical protein N8K70_10440 [Microbacterium betulae]|uniref:Nitrate ABC transporter substrate-binding protein n=1 Tax=Microbacterium betulae TaxID=2981139 RepID=A0AA97FES2_9MICO|nr:hypothetical protein [Microbacterium sp. AB]WOF21803.1 hypothetical protein N8K70_10440 [Microbacterium sp. AB]